MAFVRISYLKTLTRKFSSALYVTGDKAQNNFVVLTPYIDFEEQIKYKSDLLKSIKARKLSIDLERVEKRWNFFKMIDDHKNILEMTKSEINNLINKLKSENLEQNKADIEKLLLHVKMVKDDLKNVKDYYYGIEESAALAVLGLPNFLHPKTPLDSELILHHFCEKPTPVNRNHIDIAESQHLLQYTNPMFYFLKSEASLFEFAIINYFQKSLLDLNYTQFSNADFSRSIVIEGCGTDYLDKNRIFTLENYQSDLSKLHLVGGASLYSFMSYFARHSLQAASLPLRLFTIGRNYQPVGEGDKRDLFHLNQQSVVQVFVSIEDDALQMDEILNNISQQLIQMYESLGYHFRLVCVPACDLKTVESLKLSIQMFSNYSQEYIEVGNLSLYDNFLSKRLLFTYGTNKERKFVKIIAGQLLNVQKFLGCALENNISNQSPLLSDLLQKYM